VPNAVAITVALKLDNSDLKTLGYAKIFRKVIETLKEESFTNHLLGD
jgi:hypothetical protein